MDATFAKQILDDLIETIKLNFKIYKIFFAYSGSFIRVQFYYDAIMFTIDINLIDIDNFKAGYLEFYGPNRKQISLINPNYAQEIIECIKTEDEFMRSK